MQPQTSADPATDKKSTEELIRGINWFHRIDLGDGIVTPGADHTSRKINKLRLPPSLAGKTFLDIGAWDGALSFEAERRGASRVLATDSFVWEGKVPGHSKAGFLAARKILDSRVEDMTIDPFDLSPTAVGMWDVVLLAGVLYHVKHPWLLIERAAGVTRELLILETCTDLRFTLRPAVALYPGDELAGDPSNWCAPNLPALKAMLRDCGFKDVRVASRVGFRAFLWTRKSLLKFAKSPLAGLQRGRCVVHARR